MNLVFAAGFGIRFNCEVHWEITGYTSWDFEFKASRIPGFRIGDVGFIFGASREGNGIFRPIHHGTHTCNSSSLKLKRHIHYEEEQTMAKRYGNFVNPTTGETDWLEPSTISIVALQPKMVTRVGETSQSAIDFKLDCTPDEEHITLVAEYTADNKKYTSAAIMIPSETFAEAFAPVVYQDIALDESDMIKQAKDEASQDLTRRLMDNNVLMGGMQFAGFGYVYVENEKVMTIELIDFEYKIENGRPVKNARIRNCVSQASLANLENPQIKFYTGTHLVELLGPVVDVEKSTEGRVKNYALTIEDITIKTNGEMPQHTVFDEVDFDSEEFVDRFVSDRKNMLDDIIGTDSAIDDQFSGLFD